MRIAVFGTGGVGGYFGGRLARSGEDVVFIARGEHLKAMQTDGLRVDSVNGDFVVQPASATSDPASVGVVDCVLVCLKAWQVAEAAPAMQPMVGPDTMVVPLLNGVEAPDQLAAVLGEEHVLGGLCRIISFIAGPGHIRHPGMEPFVAFGELDNRASERVERLRKAFEAAGVQAEVPPDIGVAMWTKFQLIVGWSGVGAVTRSSLGIWRSLPGTRQMFLDAMEEVAQVAQARGINVPQEAVSKSMAFIDSLPSEGTASMQRDIQDGRPSELEGQSGSVVRLGQEAGVATPVNSFIYHSLLPQESIARGEVHESG